MVIRRNMSALRSLRERGKTTRAMAKNLEKLSSGLRINRASDDAAGLSISEKMRVNITELGRCQSNVEEGLDLARTADGALQELNDMLCRARELCIEAENGTYSDQERAAISDELNQLFGEIDRITASSKYNTIPLFRGDMSGHYRDIYNEIINGTGDSQFAQWGNMEFVLDKEFDPAEPAKPASATFQLNAKVNLNDAKSLDGMSLKVGSKTYYFTTTPETTPHSSVYTDAINLNNYSTVQDAFDAVTKSTATDSYTHLSSISVKDDGTVTLEAKLSTLTTHILADGKNITWNVKDGSGNNYNGELGQNSDGNQTLQQVDGSGAANNKPAYS
ncbi:MAG: flagellin, partial [Oscillospiraceae bacterium]|nr:flagellin [Oscillospiraceae bacterium]